MTPSPRDITSWIMRSAETLSPLDVAQLETVRNACPEIASAKARARCGDVGGDRLRRSERMWRRQDEQRYRSCQSAGSITTSAPRNSVRR